MFLKNPVSTMDAKKLKTNNVTAILNNMPNFN